MASQKRAVLIAGPTASGKSALALERARGRDALIVNADAMQVYERLSVLTARPTPADMVMAEHRLYGVVSPAIRFSTGAWAGRVAELLKEADGRSLIFVGGTGLYFDVLTKGFADVPPVPSEVLKQVEEELEGLDAPARGSLLANRDPEMARRLKAPDPQRVARALAVLAATGRSLAWFQDQVHAPLLAGFALERIVLNPDRAVLAERIATRLRTMFEGGAIEEVRDLRALKLDPSLPAMKAIGVPEIGAMLEGHITKAEALERASIATRQYAKRQRTWFRARMADWTWIDPLAKA